MNLYKTTIVFEVLHDDPLPDDLELKEIVEETTYGHASGDIKSFETVEVTKEEMTQLLIDQRSNPKFLVEDWNDEKSAGV